MLAFARSPDGNTQANRPYIVTSSGDAPPDTLGTGLGMIARKPAQAEGMILTEGAGPSVATVSVEEVYRAPEFGSVELRSALKLLPDAVAWCDRALLALAHNEYFQADDATVHLQALLAELFCCRTIGDGFAEVVNAAQSSIENLNGKPMERAQIAATQNALATLRREPRISFDRSLDLVSAMEQVGLAVDPFPVDVLADWLSDE